MMDFLKNWIEETAFIFAGFVAFNIVFLALLAALMKG